MNSSVCCWWLSLNIASSRSRALFLLFTCCSASFNSSSRGNGPFSATKIYCFSAACGKRIPPTHHVFLALDQSHGLFVASHSPLVFSQPPSPWPQQCLRGPNIASGFRVREWRLPCRGVILDANPFLITFNVLFCGKFCKQLPRSIDHVAASWLTRRCPFVQSSWRFHLHRCILQGQFERTSLCQRSLSQPSHVCSVSPPP